ncbi:MAG: type II toxin-antitoxin system RelB/DinJ family antitoxin [Bacteroidaceae bacterium]|jgi:DNA-damage-inducible protein J|nr:type II toxin-antitoxin system RelB/DinJ family antitoxin [Bacteroidaceae bacterium]
MFDAISVKIDCILVLFGLYLQPKGLIMGQTAFTVRMDSEVKRQFDELCRDFGMSSNTAFNVFAKTVIKKQCIPFEVESERQSKLRLASEAFDRIRKQISESNSPELTMEEIDEEIRRYREERRNNNQ